MDTDSKVCKACGIEKPLTEFAVGKRYTGGYRPNCKVCHNKDNEAYRRRKGVAEIPVIRDGNLKQCNVCKQWIEMCDSNFHKSPKTTDGYAGKCKPCSSEYNKQHREINKEELSQKAKERHRRNPEPARIRAQKHYRDNADAKKAGVTNYKRRNKGKVNAYKQSREALKLNPPYSFDDGDWQRALEYFSGKCAVCGRPPGLWHKLAMDHWIPLTSPECPGTVPSNIVPLCHGQDGCNNSKAAKPAAEWLARNRKPEEVKRILERIQSFFKYVSKPDDPTKDCCNK